MEHLSTLVSALNPTWQQLIGGDFRLIDNPSLHQNGNVLSAAITNEEKTLAWLQATPPAAKIDQAQLLLQSWATLLSQIEDEHQMSAGLTEKLIGAWNRLSFFHQVSELMRTTTDPWQLSLEVLRFAMETMEAQNAFVAQLIDNALAFQWIQPDYSKRQTQQIIAPLQTLNKILVRNGAACRATFPELLDLHSFMGQQLSVRVGPASFIGFINQTTRGNFDAGDIQLFDSLVEQLAAVIDVDALHTQRLKAKQLDRDLEIAAEVQASFLPDNWPELSGYELATAFIPASKIGGDFYDVSVTDDSVDLLVCDVAGKGISAALLAADIRAKIKIEVRKCSDPGQVLQKANLQLYEDMQRIERFATAILVSLSTEKLSAQYASAGHTTAFLIQANPLGVQYLPSMNVPLGVFPHMDDRSSPIDIQPNDVLVIYSDGLTEVEDEQGQILGITGVTDVLLATHSAPAQFILDSLLEANQNHRGVSTIKDDLTLLVIKKVPDNITRPNYLARLHLPCDLSVLSEIENKLAALGPYLPKSSYTETWLIQVQLAMTEAVSNIIRHSYARCSGSIHGLIALYPDELQIDLFDSGEAYELTDTHLPDFDDLNEISEGGLGLGIIYQAMDTVSYDRLSNGYNHWRYCRGLPKPHADLNEPG